MKKVTIWHCDRCGLDFVQDNAPAVCPACIRHYSGEVVIRLAGRNVKIDSVRLYGDNPLKQRAMTKGLDSLRLGNRCPHGFLSWHICNACK